MSVLRAVSMLACAATASALTLTGSLGPMQKGAMQGPMTAADGMTAWSTTGLTLEGLSAHQVGGTYLDVSAITAPGSTVTVTADAGKPVLLYAFVSSCHPCPSTLDGLVSHLVTDQGWSVGGCGPDFRDAATGQRHRMISLVKYVFPRSQYTLTIPGCTEYVSFVATETFTDCRTFQSQDTCEAPCATTDEHCEWDASTGRCGMAYCRKNVGPAQSGCSVPASCAPPAAQFLL